MTHHFVYTGFHLNRPMTIDNDDIKVKLADHMVGFNLKELEALCLDAIPLAFEQFNPNAFLLGLELNGKEGYYINFHADVVKDKLVLRMASYGLTQSGLAKAGKLSIETGIPAKLNITFSENEYGEIDSHYEYVAI